LTAEVVGVGHHQGQLASHSVPSTTPRGLPSRLHCILAECPINGGNNK